jgi:hypothetical protein
VLSTSSASTVARWHPPPTPPLTAVALHPPPPSSNARAHLGLFRKLECVHCVLLQLPLHFFLCPQIGGVEATITSSSIIFSSLLFPCPAPHLLLPSFVGMATIVAVAPSSMADCCAFLSPVHHLVSPLRSIMQSLARSMLDHSKGRESINPSSADFNPTAIRDVVEPRLADAAVLPILQPCHPVGGMILH